MSVSIAESKRLRNKYHQFTQILLDFEQYSEKSDLEVIQRYVKNWGTEQLMEVIKSGKELLELSIEEFPEEWVIDTANGYGIGFKTARDWVIWIVATLEEEGKKAGKL